MLYILKTIYTAYNLTKNNLKCLSLWWKGPS